MRDGNMTGRPFVSFADCTLLSGWVLCCVCIWTSSHDFRHKTHVQHNMTHQRWIFCPAGSTDTRLIYLLQLCFIQMNLALFLWYTSLSRSHSGIHFTLAFMRVVLIPSLQGMYDWQLSVIFISAHDGNSPGSVHLTFISPPPVFTHYTRKSYQAVVFFLFRVRERKSIQLPGGGHDG